MLTNQGATGSASACLDYRLLVNQKHWQSQCHGQELPEMPIFSEIHYVFPFASRPEVTLPIKEASHRVQQESVGGSRVRFRVERRSPFHVAFPASGLSNIKLCECRQKKRPSQAGQVLVRGQWCADQQHVDYSI